MMSKICCGYDLRIGSIIVLIFNLFESFLSPLISPIEDYGILNDDEMPRDTVSETRITLILTCIIIGTAMYGIIEKRASWLILYLALGAIGIVYEFFTPYVIITDEKKTDDVSKEIKMIYFIVSYAISVYGYIVIFMYYKHLKKNDSSQQNGRIIALPAASAPYDHQKIMV
ncbi:uncharacterized protein LOC122858250 [Aphidius gifuensis]|uniref:uncharacterized protein LOC122858250 n=1 Tax=Aphidius gifuensis TaxID=684658 RepID=UPI001CDB617D|nr:uncharacterized protein LOC122858250 [Aphidius gifuensis]XP_044016957.1 uncharacterized protein LOC122858250 [Aphidius gifuensis]